MGNILNLKTYNKYLNLIKEGLVLLPDNTLTMMMRFHDAFFSNMMFSKIRKFIEKNDYNESGMFAWY